MFLTYGYLSDKIYTGFWIGTNIPCISSCCNYLGIDDTV